MPLMEWNDALVLDEGVIDGTHREFVDLLNRLYDAPDSELLRVLDEFIAHSEAHFGQEQRWMEDLEFPPLSCHVGEHEGVMEIAREVRRRAADALAVEARDARVMSDQMCGDPARPVLRARQQFPRVAGKQRDDGTGFGHRADRFHLR